MSIWIISDGKPGHLNQSLGLALALQRRQPDWSIETLPALSRGQALTALLTKRYPGTGNLAKPALVIAAGHRTHLSLLAAGRATGAKTAVLMTPSLPLGWFDFCLIPKHDNPSPRSNVIATQGALNKMQPAEAVPSTGMILIGGPSAHFGWDQQQLIGQLTKLTAAPGRQWLITTSRRTPAATTSAVLKLASDTVEVVPFEQTDGSWLPENLPGKEVCWVTADSVSMVFEALTAGCRTGVLPVPQLKETRVVRGQQLLVDEGLVAQFSGESEQAVPPVAKFDEAGRCAERLLQTLSGKK